MGLARLADDSGSRRGPRRVAGGRGVVRSVLYMAAQAAAIQPGAQEFAERLEAAGKKPKVVLVAVARKLVVIANAILRSKKPWDPATAGSPNA